MAINATDPKWYASAWENIFQMLRHSRRNIEGSKKAAELIKLGTFTRESEVEITPYLR